MGTGAPALPHRRSRSTKRASCCYSGVPSFHGSSAPFLRQPRAPRVPRARQDAELPQDTRLGAAHPLSRGARPCRRTPGGARCGCRPRCSPAPRVTRGCRSAQTRRAATAARGRSRGALAANGRSRACATAGVTTLPARAALSYQNTFLFSKINLACYALLLYNLFNIFNFLIHVITLSLKHKLL